MSNASDMVDRNNRINESHKNVLSLMAEHIGILLEVPESAASVKEANKYFAALNILAENSLDRGTV